MVRLAVISTAAALLGAASVAADFSITAPSSNNWWVAKSQNTLSWSCNDSPPAQQFTVLVANKNVNVLTAPIAIIGVMNNYDCSQTITQDQSNQPAGVGYTIQFASIVNQSNILATSEEFEIKPLGSLYPSQVSASASASGANSTSTAAGSSATKKASGATSIVSSAAGLGLAFLGAALGLVAA